MYDIIIIGSGPAGLTAAVYARRAEKTVLILEKASFGGQITYSPKVENFPGEIEISGNALAEKLIDQALNLGAEIELAQVTKIEKKDRFFIVSCDTSVYESKSVIIASGSKHRKLNLPLENEFIGNGISYCAVCDGAFFQGKQVAVIGGGNTALQDAVLLCDICKKVTIIQNLGFFTGEKKLLDILSKRDNVSFIKDSVVTELRGSSNLEGIVIENTKKNEKSYIAADGVFVAIGQVPENEVFSDIAELDSNGYIISDESCTTSTPGIFAAGDCRAKSIRQVVTASSDGAISALAACKYIDSLN